MLSKIVILPLLLLTLLACQGQHGTTDSRQHYATADTVQLSEVESYFFIHVDSTLDSKSTGDPHNGTLINGKILPFRGENYRYFDTASYLGGRAFLHGHVLTAIMQSYDSLAINHPGRIFTIMECSNKDGGKIPPHRTHQNGLSVDFMVPVIRNGLADYQLDTIGASHYLLTFDDEGKYVSDPKLQIDFDLIAEHILILQEAAEKNGLAIEKIIFKMELKDELYNSKFGKELKNSGIYVTKNLSSLINSLHDDHYHIDFHFISK